MYNIVFAGDEAYIKYTAVAITSIIENTDVSLLPSHFTNKQEEEKERYIFHILTDSFSEDLISKVEDLEKGLNELFISKCASKNIKNNFLVKVILYSSTDDLFQGQPKWRGNYLTYYRLKTTELIKINCEKLLYLDGDILVNCDIRELFAIDLSNNVLAAIKDYGGGCKSLKARNTSFLSSQKIEDFKFTRENPYFNAGVLLINYPLWKELEIEKKALKILKDYIGSTPDQDAINASVIGKTLLLPFKWNAMISLNRDFEDYIYIDESNKANSRFTRQEHTEGIQNPKIIHYIKKPWNSDKLVITDKYKPVFYPNHDLWWKIAEICPVFSKELSSIKESENYINALKKEQDLAYLFEHKPFSLQVLTYKFKRKTRPFFKKIEQPFKDIRNIFRSKKVSQKMQKI